MFTARQTDASYTSHYNSTTVAVGKSHMIVVDTLYVAVKNYTEKDRSIWFLIFFLIFSCFK